MIEVEHHINAVRREVGTKVLKAGEARIVRLARTYPTTVEDLWDACTTAERIPRWFLPITGDLRVGGRYQLEGNAGGTIESCDPPHQFGATWEYGGQTSWIDVRVEPDSDGARLVLEHLAHVDDHFGEFGPGAVGIGWDLGLIGLALHIDTGEQVDARAFEAWSTSDDGKRYVTGCSDRWRDADIAAGADPEAATAAADRTAAAYTGETPN